MNSAMANGRSLDRQCAAVLVGFDRAAEGKADNGLRLQIAFLAWLTAAKRTAPSFTSGWRPSQFVGQGDVAFRRGLQVRESLE